MSTVLPTMAVWVNHKLFTALKKSDEKTLRNKKERKDFTQLLCNGLWNGSSQYSCVDLTNIPCDVSPVMFTQCSSCAASTGSVFSHTLSSQLNE